jgi:spermidine synthase
MAVIWQKYIDGKKYQVREAGKTRRLYTNGVCHSEFNPDKLVTGSIWDLLILPAFFYSSGEIRRVLMLGVGGGASILQLHHLLEPDSICGVELNPVHLDIARRFFKVDVVSVDLYESDAHDWLDEYSGEPFDMIVDDLFVDEASEPVRAIEANTEWFNLILKHLSKKGHLVANFGSHEEFMQSAYFRNAKVRKRFASAFRLTSPLLENVVGAFMRIETDSKMLREGINAHPLLARSLQSKQLRYRIRKMSCENNNKQEIQI